MFAGPPPVSCADDPALLTVEILPDLADLAPEQRETLRIEADAHWRGEGRHRAAWWNETQSYFQGRILQDTPSGCRALSNVEDQMHLLIEMPLPTSTPTATVIPQSAHPDAKIWDRPCPVIDEPVDDFWRGIMVAGSRDLFRGLEYLELARAIETGSPVEVGPQLGMEALAICYGTLESGLSGQPVRMSQLLEGEVEEYQAEINEAAGL